VIQIDPPPLAAILEGVPASLSSLVQRCLSKRPDERPKSAEALVEVLERLLPDTTPHQALHRRATALNGTMQIATPAATVHRQSGARIFLILAAIGALMAWLALEFRPTPETRSTVSPHASATLEKSENPAPTSQVAVPAQAEQVASDPQLAPELPRSEAPPPQPGTTATASKPAAPASVETVRRAEQPTSTAQAADDDPPVSASNPTESAVDKITAPASPEPPEVATTAPTHAESPLPPEPEVEQISPRVLRRGQTARIEVSGRYLDTVVSGEVLLGTGADPRFVVGKLTPISNESLALTVSVSRSVPLGRYFLVLSGAQTRSAPILLEVGL